MSKKNKPRDRDAGTKPAEKPALPETKGHFVRHSYDENGELINNAS
jgi:hypothetical protein